MKRILLLLSVLLCLFLCSCGVFVDTDTPKSAELSNEYDFYENSVASIRGACNVSPEEADEIFIILVNNCGVDKEISVSSTINAPYSVKYGFKTLSMVLDNKVVSTVSDGDKQLYPVTSDSTESIDKDAETETAAESNTETSVPHRTDSDIVGVSDKDISDIDIYYYGDVKNDVTGNWRYSMTADNIDIENYALSYYKTYFKSDSEIHGIVNFTRKTTSSIRVNGGIMFLDIYDYVDGEEKDAKLMFSGTLLKSYMIYTDNGDIQQIQ